MSNEKNKPAVVKPPEKKRDVLYAYILPLLEIVFIIFVLRTFILEAYQVPTGSMIDTILPGDFLLVEKVTYKMHTPKKGEVIVFKYPLDPRVKYVKRCIATAGDTVETRDKILFVNGIKSQYQAAQLADSTIYPRHPHAPTDPSELTPYWLRHEFIKDSPYFRDNFGPVVVPSGMVFGMGDNRDDSYDSRFWGPVPLKYITGRPTFIYLSTDLADNIQMDDRRNLNMADNIVLMLKSIVMPWHIRWDRMIRIIQ